MIGNGGKADSDADESILSNDCSNNDKALNSQTKCDSFMDLGAMQKYYDQLALDERIEISSC